MNTSTCLATTPPLPRRPASTTPFLYLLLGLLLLLGLTAPVPAAPPPLGEQDPALEKRLRGLEEELRCLVCQNQNVADSPSEWADGMRDEIRGMLRQGMSDEEVVDFLISRYGDFVTYRPPVKPLTYFLWFGPIAFLLIAIVGLLIFVRGRSREQPQELSEAERKRADSILGVDDKDKK